MSHSLKGFGLCAGLLCLTLVSNAARAADYPNRTIRVVVPKLSAPDVLSRIKALAIPPAWSDVRLCPFADGHIQATGRDAKGRKQYRYHPRFREVRESTKYKHVVEFADALPDIREKVREHMALRGLPETKSGNGRPPFGNHAHPSG